MFQPFASGPQQHLEAYELGNLLNCPPFVGNILDAVKALLARDDKDNAHHVFTCDIPGGGCLRIYHFPAKETE